MPYRWQAFRSDLMPWNDPIPEAPSLRASPDAEARWMLLTDPRANSSGEK